MIRDAVMKDIPTLVNQYEKFYHTTEHSKSKPFDVQSVRNRCSELIDAGILLVATRGESIIGSIGIKLIPFPFNENFLSAFEIVLYIEPEEYAKGLGKSLLYAAEIEAKNMGCYDITMASLSTSPSHVHDFYVSEGYSYMEKTYLKVL